MRVDNVFYALANFAFFGRELRERFFLLFFLLVHVLLANTLPPNLMMSQVSNIVGGLDLPSVTFTL